MCNRYGYVYKIRNKINNKIYIGQKKSEFFVESYWGSGTLITKAIDKYGVENFTRDIIEWCNSKDSLNEREKYWIDHYNARDKEKGYNIAMGGTVIGMKHSAEVIEKIKKSNMGQTRTDAAKRKMSASHKGKTLSEEHKRHISETQKTVMVGKNKGKKPTEEIIKKRAEKLKGRSVSEETRKKLSEANKKNVGKIIYHINCKKCGNNFTSYYWSRKYCDECKEEGKL